MADDKPVINQTLVAEYVEPEARIWEGGKFPIAFIDVHFSDGSVGGVGVNPTKVDEARESLKALVGKPSVYGVIDDGEYQNKQKWKIREWEGKPGGLTGGGGGGGNRGGGGMSHAQVGYLMASNQLAIGPELPNVDVLAAETIRLGEIYVEALFARKPPAQETTAEEETGAPAVAAVQPAIPAEAQITLPQMTAIKRLAETKFKLTTVDEIVGKLGVGSLGEITAKDADDLIELWGAEPDAT